MQQKCGEVPKKWWMKRKTIGKKKTGTRKTGKTRRSKDPVL